MTNLEELIERGLGMTARRRAASPEAAIYASLQAQLEYLRDVVAAGERPSEEKLDRLTLGLYAAREFEASDPEYADVLFEVSYAVNRTEPEPPRY